MHPASPLQGTTSLTHTAQADFHKRLEQSSASLLGTMAAVVRRGSLHLINTSSIPTLVKRVQRGEQAAAPAHTLLTYASKHCPALYTSHVAELAKALTDEKNPQLVEVCLQALAGVVQWDNSLYPTDKCVLSTNAEGWTHRDLCLDEHLND
jgi:sister-chromatid-cohesion protein PDS5